MIEIQYLTFVDFVGEKLYLYWLLQFTDAKKKIVRAVIWF